MFDKVSQVAEQTATSTSRRQFLGRLGRGAMLAAAAAGGLLALPGEIRAAPGPRESRGSHGCPPGCYRVRGSCICR